MQQKYARFAMSTFTALLFMIFYPSSAWAGEVVSTNILSPQLTDWSTTIQVDQFDPSLGTLLRVDAVIAGDLVGTARYESLDNMATDMTVEMKADVDLRWPDGPIIITALPNASRTQPATEYDGEMDFAGTSGATMEGLIGFDVSETSSYTKTLEVQPFIGIGQSDFQIDVTGRSRAQGAGNLSARFTLVTSAQVTITYTYGNPAIDLEKSTNGEDADEPTGPHIPVGGAVQWSYVVTNTGDMTLIDVVVSDDQGVTVSCPQSTLAPAETMLCTATGTAVAGQYANMGTVVAQPVDLVGSPRGNTVTDADKSHYYGDETSCPVNVLPDVVYLGESDGIVPQSYVMPEGFDTFIIKRRKPFRFITPDDEFNAQGQKIYNATPGHIERVWACSGDCGFHETLKEELALGFLKAGTHIELLIIDDDVDNRWDWWAHDDPLVPYQLVDIQAMVEIAVFDVPFDADWYFYTEDSIGIVSICILEPTATTTGSGAARENLSPASARINPNKSQTTFLPFVVH